MIETECERHGAVATHCTVSWLDASGAAETGWDADAAAGVAAHSGKDHACRNRRAAAATGSAGDAGWVPGIANGAIVSVVGSDAKGELVHAQFASENCAGGLKAFDHGCIVAWDEIAEDLAAARSARALGVEEIFDRDRDALQGAFVESLCQLGVGLFGRSEGGVFSEGHEGVELGLEVLAALDALLC